ncbi:MAG: restriction endonuclease subunit S, partial [Segetibacter sp.]|nr:restriction endonuclease subunit S [Segetibacter sp.]
SDINQFIVWDAPQEVQSKIAEYVLQAYDLEKQSQQLLEAAKQAVEIAIEEGEEKAMEFIQIIKTL